MMSIDIRKYIFAFMLVSDILNSIRMPNARQKILKYILEQQNVTAEELSKVFHVTPANIRHHLAILSEQGSVKIVGQKEPAHKGRPAQIYTSSQQLDQNNLANLVSALLTSLLENVKLVEQKQLLKQVAGLLGQEYRSGLINPTRRLYSAIYSLNRMRYQAHWEARIENPRIMIGHCPYRDILDSHPEVCEIDSYLLENLLGGRVQQIEKLTADARGRSQCVFLLDNPPIQ
jgi:predicted ArsR family transcriptional regulator